MKNEEPTTVGRTKEAQERNAELLSDYDYGKYVSALTGFSGQDRQCIRVRQRFDAVRTRVGPRGHFKSSMTQLSDGRLLIAVCRKKQVNVPLLIYESCDLGLSWQEIAQFLPGDYNREMSLTTLLDDSLVLTAANATGVDRKRCIPLCRSTDGGHSWETDTIEGDDCPRNIIVEADGSLLMVRALERMQEDTSDETEPIAIPVMGGPNLRLDRSRDGGKTWEFSEGIVDWDYCTWGEMSCIRLKDGRLLATMRNQIPGTEGEGFEDTYVTESSDDGKHWSKPWRMGNTAEVHAYLTELDDGRILATYVNYHLPWGIYAVVSEDGGRSWSIDNPIELALSSDLDSGWPVTLQLPDSSLITCYGNTTYLQVDCYNPHYMKWPSEKQTCEIVRWHLPPKASC